MPSQLDDDAFLAPPRPIQWVGGRPACAGLPLDLFYEEHLPHKALRICRTCPVRVQCVQFAIDTGDHDGVKGVAGSDREDYEGTSAVELIQISDARWIRPQKPAAA